MEETFLRSIKDPVGIKQCYEMYGAVGITGVLDKTEIQQTIKEIQGIMRETIDNDDFNLRDYNTFHLADQNLNSHGVIGNGPLMTPMLIRNRLHKNVRKAYSIVYGMNESQLLAQFDRVSWMRPTIGPNHEDWTKYRTPFHKPGLHLDVDPCAYHDPGCEKMVRKYLETITFQNPRDFIHENNAKNIKMGIQLQGVLNLFDNKEEDGGFHFAPGAHKILKDWYSRRKETLGAPAANGRYYFTPMDYEFQKTNRIPCPAGTLIIFDAALPHGTKPNFSYKQRMIQFLRYMPKNTLNKKSLKNRKKYLLKLINQSGYKLSPEEKVVM